MQSDPSAIESQLRDELEAAQMACSGLRDELEAAQMEALRCQEAHESLHGALDSLIPTLALSLVLVLVVVMGSMKLKTTRSLMLIL